MATGNLHQKSKLSFEWNVPRAFLRQNRNTFESPEFECCDITWNLTINVTNQKVMYLYLSKVSWTEKQVPITFKLSVKKTDGTDYMCVVHEQNFHMLCDEGSKFITLKETDLMSSDVSPHGILTVTCNISPGYRVAKLPEVNVSSKCEAAIANTIEEESKVTEKKDGNEEDLFAEFAAASAANQKSAFGATVSLPSLGFKFRNPVTEFSSSSARNRIDLNQEHKNNFQRNFAVFQTKVKTKQDLNVTPLSFHKVHGENVILKQNRSIVSRKVGCYSLGYAFTEHPVEIGKTIVLKVSQTDPCTHGFFVYGITSCNPRNIDVYKLPEASEDLLDRPEYWVVKEKYYPYNVGDIIKFTVNNQGQVTVMTNDVPDPVLYVDHTQPLWFFVNMTHLISELQLVGVLCTNSSKDILNDEIKNLKLSAFKKTEAGLSVEQSFTECVICYEEPVDSAVYRCGHMCMCYKCALKLWKSNSTAQCPVCRSYITDIIKIYK